MEPINALFSMHKVQSKRVPDQYNLNKPIKTRKKFTQNYVYYGVGEAGSTVLVGISVGSSVEVSVGEGSGVQLEVGVSEGMGDGVLVGVIVAVNVGVKVGYLVVIICI